MVPKEAVVFTLAFPNVLMEAFGFCVSRISMSGEQLTGSEFTGITVSYRDTYQQWNLLGSGVLVLVRVRGPDCVA